MAAQLSCHVQNFLANTLSESRHEHNKMFIEFELWNKRQQNGPEILILYKEWFWLPVPTPHREMFETKQGKSEGFDSCDRPSNLAQIWSKSSIFQPVWPWNLMYDLEK